MLPMPDGANFHLSPGDEDLFCCVYEGDVLKGFFVAKELTTKMINVHALLFKGSNGLQIGKCYIKHIKENFNRTITANVYDFNRPAILACVYAGLQQCGRIKNAATYKGVNCDLLIFAG